MICGVEVFYCLSPDLKKNLNVKQKGLAFQSIFAQLMFLHKDPWLSFR